MLLLLFYLQLSKFPPSDCSHSNGIPTIAPTINHSNHLFGWWNGATSQAAGVGREKEGSKKSLVQIPNCRNNNNHNSCKLARLNDCATGWLTASMAGCNRIWFGRLCIFVVVIIFVISFFFIIRWVLLGPFLKTATLFNSALQPWRMQASQSNIKTKTKCPAKQRKERNNNNINNNNITKERTEKMRDETQKVKRVQIQANVCVACYENWCTDRMANKNREQVQVKNTRERECTKL